MEKGTITMMNLTRVSKKYTQTVYGSSSFVGLGKAKAVSIFFQGSYNSSAGTSAMLEIFGALTPHAGSVDPTAIGSLVLGIAVTAAKRRIKPFTQLNEYPFIICKVTHRTGTAGLHNVLAKAIIQYD